MCTSVRVEQIVAMPDAFSVAVYESLLDALRSIRLAGMNLQHAC